MGVLSDAAVSRGDTMQRLAELEQQVKALQTARRMEATSARGQFRVFDSTGDVFRVRGGTDPDLFLRPDLLTPHAVAILADRTSSTPESTTLVEAPTDTNYGLAHLSGSPGGGDITLSGVNVITGAVLVTVSARVTVDVQAGTSSQAAHVSYAISGATEQDATDLRGARLQTNDPNLVSATVSKTTFISTLSPGFHTFAMQYRIEQSAQPMATFAFRNLTVMAF